MENEWIEIDERLKFRILEDANVQIEYDENTLNQEQAEAIVTELLDELMKRFKDRETAETNL